MEQRFRNDSIAVPSLDKMRSLIIDDDGFWHRPEYPEYKLDLAAPKPFLVPSFDKGVVEVLPSEKQNRKICFVEEVSVLEIENRFQMMEPDEMDDDESYEIEIVEGSGEGNGQDDADFYLEMIDGEIFYVFETEDDISVSDEENDSDESSDSSSSTSESEMQTPSGGPIAPLQLNFGELIAPTLDDSMVLLDTTFDMVEVSVKEEKKMSEGVESQPIENEKPQNGNGETSNVVTHPDESDSPDRGPKPSIGGFDTPPGSPDRLPCGAFSPSPPTTPKSILKIPASPGVSSPSKAKRDKKLKKEKTNKKEKTFSRTFVRAADFDGEHRVYSWEKPTWANQQLKSTGKGDDIRQGANLSGPITDANKLIKSGKVKWEKPEWARCGDESDRADDLDAKEELIRQIQDGIVSLPGLQHNKRRLRLSVNGSVLAEGGDIVKPITKATIIRKPANINHIANPKILRATPGGQKLWNGENLAGPVTQATNVKKYGWEKPSWVKAKLNPTNSSENVKAGQEVVPAENESSITWEKPDWAKKRGVSRGHSEIGFASKKEYSWEKPSWAKSRINGTADNPRETSTTLKPTDKGQLALQGGKLEKPITFLPHMNGSSVESQPDKEKPGVRRTKSHGTDT